MKRLDLSGVQEAGTYEKLPPGGYICGILNAIDYPNKEYLEIEFDIVDGHFKNHFKEQSKSLGFWGGRFIRSYKKSALPFFKSFTTALYNSNNGFDFDYDEQSLRGKYIGLVIGEEEYINRKGELKTSVYVKETRSIEAIQKGEFKIPELKKLQQTPLDVSTLPEFVEMNDDEFPF